MPDESSETVNQASDGGDLGRGPARSRRVLEIAEALVLTMVAIATAWAGYQAANWGGRQAFLYGRASTNRFEADAASTLGGQQLVADATVFTAWLQARDAGNAELQAVLVRRFTPDYRTAFEAWLGTDPFIDPTAPPGPGYMPGFRNPSLEAAKRLNAQASSAFEEGTAARETANKYIRATVLFASVLLVVAIGQRFTLPRVRTGAAALAAGLLAVTLFSVMTLPRL
jgi:hypothetical protein